MYEDWSMERLVEMRKVFDRLIAKKKQPEKESNLDETMTHLLDVRKTMRNLKNRLQKKVK